MIRFTIKQIWNKRRSNGWILIELILVTFFMWKVIDPVFVLLANRAIDSGYNIENTYRLSLAEYASTHSKHQQEATTDSLRRINFQRIYDRVRQLPEVSAAVVTYHDAYPSSGSYMGMEIFTDSIEYPAQLFEFYADGEYFKVFGMEDNVTGNPDHRSFPLPAVYLTESVAQNLFGEEECMNGTVFIGDSSRRYQVVGSVDKFKYRRMQQPDPLVFIPLNDLSVRQNLQICFRVHDQVNQQQFVEEFKNEIAPQLHIGNYYFLSLTDFHTIQEAYEFQSGATNTFRIQTALALFFLICTFLGISGTFWLRANSRKSEIGLRMAVGSSRKEILKNFLCESWLLTTIAWVIGILIVLQYVYYTGFASDYLTDNTTYIQNRPVPHFLIVSFIVYLLMSVISLIGTWIPASRAAKTEPAEALHNE